MTKVFFYFIFLLAVCLLNVYLGNPILTGNFVHKYATNLQVSHQKKNNISGDDLKLNI